MRVTRSIVADFKDRDDKWIQSFRDKACGKMIRTYAGCLWGNLLLRTSKSDTSSSYFGVRNGFQSFQEFAEWCNLQQGYGNDDWQLDKDILHVGNKVYCAECCVFVPRELNNFFISAKYCRGQLPTGVCKKGAKFVATCPNSVDVKKNLGYFECPKEAFIAYKAAKEEVARLLAVKWGKDVDSRVVVALNNFEVNIDN